MTFSLAITFKNMQIKKEQLQADKIHLPASDLAVGRISLQEATTATDFDHNPLGLTEFIRRNTLYTNAKSVYITTANYEKTDFYDIYKVPLPPVNANQITDLLYGLLVNDLRLSIPDMVKSQRLSFASLGIDRLLSEEVLDGIRQLKQNAQQKEMFLTELKEHGYQAPIQVLDFFNQLDFQVVDQSLLPMKTLDTVLQAFEPLNSKEEKVLTHYKTVAKKNSDCYISLSNLHQILYDRSLNWPSLSIDQQKILLKKSA